jgi:putative ABC transport system permease protein
VRYLPYILKHLRKNWIRTLSTVAGLAVCIFLFCTLQTVLAAINYSLESASASRLWTRHETSIVFTLPLSYKPRIAAVEGVRNVANATWFNGIYKDQRNFFPNFAVDMPEYLAMYPEYLIPPDQAQALLADRRGALIGRGLADKFGWDVGDTFQLESTIPPYRAARPFDFVVRAIYDADTVRNPGVDLSQMFFHYEYLYQTLRNNPYVQAGTYVVEIVDPSQAAEVGARIDALFANSDAQTKTETESAFIAGFIALVGNLALLLNGIGLAVTFTILLVTANTMSMAVRERRTEIAVLKTLGFPGRLVLALVLAEALFLGVVGGVLGLGLGALTIRALIGAPMLGAVLAGFPNVGLTLEVAALGMTVAAVVGLLAGLPPALTAYRAGITETLRTV